MRNVHKVLVTGGAGFIGTHLVRRLAQNTGVAITVIDDWSHRGCQRDPDWPTNVLVCRADICDAAVLKERMTGVDLVYHLAGISSVYAAQSDLVQAYRVNVLGTETVLKVAQQCAVRRVIFTSSREVYGEATELPVIETTALKPKNVYGLTKASAESCCRTASGMDVLVLRLANVYGPNDHGRVIPMFLRNALLGKPLVLYGGEQILDFIWIEDVLDALIQAGGDVVISGPLNIGTGAGCSVLDLASLILNLTRSASAIQLLPAKTFEVMRFVADNRAAKHLLNLTRISDPLVHLAELLETTKRELSFHISDSVRTVSASRIKLVCADNRRVVRHQLDG